MAGQQIQDALLQHDRVRRSTDLPVFFGVPQKDIISARNLIDRLETAAQVAAWNTDKRKCEGFYLLLRDEALIWWRSIKSRGVDQENWDQVKTAFLKSYEPKYSATTACHNLQDLHQRPGELVHRYYLRLFDTLEKFKESQPALGAVQHAPQNPIVANDLVAAKKEGAVEQDMFMRHQMFLAGLTERLRARVMEAGKANLGEAVDYAIELERIHQRSETRKVQAIQEEEEAHPTGFEDWDDDEMAAINAVRMRKGKPPLKKFGFSGGPKKGGSGPSGPIKCRYCKKLGHMQKECRSRIRDGAPMVDQEGKPFTKKVNALESKVGKDSVGIGSEGIGISSVRQTEIEPHLNW